MMVEGLGSMPLEAGSVLPRRSDESVGGSEDFSGKSED
jgi:hypothetical protein